MFKGLKNYIILGLIACLFIIAGYFIFNKISPKELASNLIAGSGRVDGDLILLNTKYPGRVESIFVQDGDKVTSNQIVATLRSKELISRAKGLESAVKATKKEKLSFAQTIKASKMEVTLLKETLPQLVKIKDENLKMLNQNLNSIILNIEKFSLQCDQYEKDYLRHKKLFKSNVISPEKFELVELKYKTTKKEFENLKIEKEKILNSIQSAKSALKIQKDNLVKIDIAKQNILASKTKLLSLDNKINQLISNKEEIDAMIEELTIKSPINGVVIDKLAQVGTVLGGGSGVALLVDPNELYLKIFIDTIENGKVKVGDKAVIFLDAYPNRAIKSKIVRVEQRAEFTPKEVQIKSDRIQLMYAVHLKPIEPMLNLKLGLPAIGVISIDGNGLPQSLNDIPEI